MMVDVQAYLNREQVMAIIAAAHASKGWRRERDVLLISMLAYTGRREGEVLAMRVGDMMPESGQVVFSILKKRYPLRRVKTLASELYQRLETYVSDMGLGMEDYVFQSNYKGGRPITPGRVRQIVYHYAEVAGLKYLPGTSIRTGQPIRTHPHTFRHSFAVALARQCTTTAGIRYIQRVMEHSSVDETMFYMQFSEKEESEMIERLYK